MGDNGEVSPKPRKKMSKEHMKESDQRLEEGSLQRDVGVHVQEQIIDDKTITGISDHAESEPSAFMKLTSGRQFRRDYVKGTVKVKGSGSFIQDQIIIAPEIMSMILVQLDLRSLKICRRVCKSWLQEAQSHLEGRTTVRFKGKGFAARMTAFKDTQQGKLLRAFAEPLSHLEVELHSDGQRPTVKGLLRQLQGILCLPIVLTRFSNRHVPLNLALPLIIKFSASLEYLKLECDHTEKPIPLDPKHNFPKLRQVHAATEYPEHGFVRSRGNNFPSIVASIVNSSPNLDTFRSSLCYGQWAEKLGNELFLKVDIKSVKSLVLSGHKFNQAAADLFVSIPFSRLEYLKFKHLEFAEISPVCHALVATMMKSVATLKKLDFSMFYHREFEELLVQNRSPVCPNVEELTLICFDKYWMRIISTHFPALRVLNAKSVVVDLLSDDWNNLPPYFGVKTLRANLHQRDDSEDELVRKFLEKFPKLERIYLDAETLAGCSRLKVAGNPRFTNICNSVKHLEIDGNSLGPRDASSLSALRGIKAITMISSNTDISLIPFQDLPCLKVIHFPWGDCLNLETLLQVARRVEKVFVSKCCSVPRVQNQESKELLNNFFDAARNAECGCGMDLPKWRGS